jgi:hypothetical protein
MVQYRIEWVEREALGLISTRGTNRPTLQRQTIPAEFKVGDEVVVRNQVASREGVEMGVGSGFYEVRHPRSGTTLKMMHRGAVGKALALR